LLFKIGRHHWGVPCGSAGNCELICIIFLVELIFIMGRSILSPAEQNAKTFAPKHNLGVPTGPRCEFNPLCQLALQTNQLFE
jgi:hypothetical protein